MSEPSKGLPAGAEPASTGGFNLYIGPLYRLPDGENGAVKRFVFVADEKHMNAAGTLHGGMILSFMDVAMSRTSRLVTGAPRCSTVSLSADFVGPGRLGDTVEARIRVTRRTHTMVFMSGEAVAGERTIAIATGLWKIPDET